MTGRKKIILLTSWFSSLALRTHEPLKKNKGVLSVFNSSHIYVFEKSPLLDTKIQFLIQHPHQIFLLRRSTSPPTDHTEFTIFVIAETNLI